MTDVSTPHPRVARDGEAFVFTWDTLGIAIRVEDIRTHSEKVSAELTPTNGNGTYFQAPTRVNLVNPRERAGFINQFKDRVKDRAPERTLDDCIQQLTVSVLRDVRTGQSETPQTLWAPKPFSALSPVGADVRWAVQGLLACGHLTSCAGLWKAGKTTLLARLLNAFAKGSPFCGLQTLVGKVCVITEESEVQWARRRDDLGIGDHVQAICKPFPTAKPGLAQWQRFLAYVASLVRQRGYLVVVFDSLFNLWGVEDENDNAEQGRWLAPLAPITDAGAAGLVITHPAKGDKTEGRATRGAGTLAGWVDILLEFRRFDPERPSDRRRVITSYSRFDETPSELVIELMPDGYQTIGSKADATEADRLDAIRTLLQPDPPGTTGPDIRAAWPLNSTPRPSARHLERMLQTAVARGQIRRNGSGVRGDPFRFYRC